MPWDSLNGGRWCDRSYEGLIRAVAGAKELITDVERRIQDAAKDEVESSAPTVVFKNIGARR